MTPSLLLEQAALAASVLERFGLAPGRVSLFDGGILVYSDLGELRRAFPGVAATVTEEPYCRRYEVVIDGVTVQGLDYSSARKDVRVATVVL